MSCIEVLQNTPTWLPFTATDVGTGSPRTGVLYTQVDVSYKKSTDIAFTLKVLVGPPTDFREIGLGVYEVLFSGAELAVLGTFIYVVNSNGALPAPALNQFIGQAWIEDAAGYTPGTISLPTNIITGNLIGLNGNALADEAVSARIISAPTVIGSLPNIGGVGTDTVATQTDAGGFFALELLQGAVVDIVIPATNYRRTLTVPANATDVLFDIP
jgi:hypothetical protein